MTAFAIQDRITGWVADELEKESAISGEDFGHHVSMALAMAPGRPDTVFWIVMVTLRSPLLGQMPMGSTGKLQGNIPPEEAVRLSVRSSCAGLRQAFEDQKLAGLPKGPGLPAGLKRLN